MFDAPIGFEDDADADDDEEGADEDPDSIADEEGNDGGESEEEGEPEEGSCFRFYCFNIYSISLP